MPQLKAEQKNAIEHDCGNILVSASAGSGKTFVMIERLIRLVREEKAKISEILAVTFTESAAADMKEKLKTALRKSVKEGNSRLADAVAEVATADISTLHSFCGRIIRTYFFTAGVSPDFAIADEAKATLIKKESIDRVFKERYISKDKNFLALVDKFSTNRSDQGLKDLVLRLFDYFSAEANPRQKALETISIYSEDNFENVVSKYKEFLDLRLSRLRIQAETALKGAEKYGIDSGVTFCKGLIEDIDGVIASDLYNVKNLENYNRTLTFGKKISPEAKEYKELATSVRDSLKKVFLEFSKHLTDRETDKEIFSVLKKDSQDVCDLLTAFSQEYSKNKREENVLDFSDLEHFTLKILQDEQCRQTVKDKYKYVFIDEYQDVNGVQEEIISLITKDNLFMVGDVKQSIYGFRGCRAEFFDEKLKQMPLDGQTTLQLNYNFRSANAVIDMVNSIFTYCMTNDRFGMDYTKNMLVSGGLFEQDAIGRAEIHALVREKKSRQEAEKPRIYDILQELKEGDKQEDVDMSSLVTDIINNELGKNYYDTKERRYKKVSFGDIAILTRNKDNKFVTDLVNGLIRHGIPVVSEVAQNICNAPEIQTLINVLKLIDNFEGDVPLASTLKSPIGGFSDEELCEIVLFYSDNEKARHPTFFDAYSYYLNKASGPLWERLTKFDLDFKNMRALSDFCGAHDILEKIIIDSGYTAYLYAQRMGENKNQRVRKFISQSVLGGRKLSVHEFLRLIESDKKAFGLAEVAEEDTVKIMTMHASKGLEFPVVIVCGLELKMRTEDGRNVCYTDREYGFAIKYFDVKQRTSNETLLRGLIKEKAKEEGVKEELRLFYVATTRATYSLHLTVNGELLKNPDFFIDANCFEQCLPKTIPVTNYSEEQLSHVQVRKDVKPVIFGTPCEQTVENIKKNIDFEYPFAQDVTLPLKSSVTKELAIDVEQTSLAHYMFEGEDTTDKERGTIAHKFMENLDFSSGEELTIQAQRMIDSGVISKTDLDKINLQRIDKAFKTGAFSDLSDKTLYKEKNFICAVEANLIKNCESEQKVVIQGAVDLLAVGEEEAFIIDYKYSTLTPESMLQKYSKQLEVYSRAFTLTTGMPVKKALLVNLFTGDVVKVI